jgi:hypothetical protein
VGMEGKKYESIIVKCGMERKVKKWKRMGRM